MQTFIYIKVNKPLKILKLVLNKHTLNNKKLTARENIRKNDNHKHSHTGLPAAHRDISADWQGWRGQRPLLNPAKKLWFQDNHQGAALPRPSITQK